MVAIPLALWSAYVALFARDQFASTVAFTVRSEDAPTASDMLGGLANFSTSNTVDTDILFEYIQSQELVLEIDKQLGLRRLFSEDPGFDLVFSLHKDATIEELVDYWQSMVHIAYTPGSGLLEVEAKSFDAETARTIAQAILENSHLMINRLSAIARQDAIRYAAEDLDASVAQLKAIREAITRFRSENQIVDVGADIQAQIGLISSLQQQLAAELVNMELFSRTIQTNDPRRLQSQQRIDAIEHQIREERAKFGSNPAGAGEDYAAVLAEFERLTVDRELAEQKYTNALANYDAAQAKAQRQSRYLATFVFPTLAESPQYPQRWILVLIATLVLFGSWAISVLVYYSLRDRR
jgi:capsular polysaccharide transport system permease protein